MTASDPWEIIPEGVRNVTLTSRAGSLRARGSTPEELLVMLRSINQAQCDPPLPDVEVRAVAASIGKKPAYPTRRRDGQRGPHIPRGCFDPRPEACGFDAAAVVEQDATLRLKASHKALFRLLRDFYGALGCHPAQSTLAEELGITRQQVARILRYLKRAGLIQVEIGACRAAGATFACDGYHFPKHFLFHAFFDASISNRISKIPGIMQQFTGGGTVRNSDNEASSQRNLEVTGDHATQTVAQVTKYIGSPWDRLSEFRFPIDVWSIVQYQECATGCGGCRIVYRDESVKMYECSCGGRG